MASSNGNTQQGNTASKYPATVLGKGQGHPQGGTAAQAVAQVLAWVARNPAKARSLPSATAVAKAAGVHAYAGQYAYRQHLRSSGLRVGRGRAWQPPQQAAARKGAAKAAQAAKAQGRAAAKAGKAAKAAKAAQPAPTAPTAQPAPTAPTAVPVPTGSVQG